MFIIPCFSVVIHLKPRKFLRKIKIVFKEIDPQLHRFIKGGFTKYLETTLSLEFCKEIHYHCLFFLIYNLPRLRTTNFNISN